MLILEQKHANNVVGHKITMLTIFRLHRLDRTKMLYFKLR